ncbi:hypothetical protein ACF3NA_08830 [Alkanindiges sp. WGS2144]|uniref:hypothetical protein n=1 Tax=Alkanindiges sp. WGS2144 TaxID=3366808 RepID=UPI0037513389
MIKHNLKLMLSGCLTGLAVSIAGCSNSLDLRPQHHDKQEEILRSSVDATALSVSEAASAVRDLKSQNLLAEQPAEVTPIQLSPQLIKQFAGRYTGQVPCITHAAPCEQQNVDVTLTLLPDGSAVRTRVQQGKVHSMLDKETAIWTVAGNGQTIMLILPNHEVWSFRQVEQGKLRYEPHDSAILKNRQRPDTTEYLLTAAS